MVTNGLERQLITTLISAQAIRCVLELRDIQIDESAKEQIFKGCNETQLFSKLLEYGSDFLDRSNKPTDLIDRVLDFKELSKIRIKYKEHIDELSSFIIDNDKPVDEFSSHYRHWKQDISKALNKLINIEHNMF